MNSGFLAAVTYKAIIRDSITNNSFISNSSIEKIYMYIILPYFIQMKALKLKKN